MARTMTDRVRLALDLAPGVVPPRFEAAYRRGGTPTSLHLAAMAEATGTTPMWLMTGWPEERTLPIERDTAMPDEPTYPHVSRTDATPAPSGQVRAIGRLQAAMLAEFERFERDRRAEIIAAGGNPDEDRDPFEHVRVIADQWADTANDDAARAAFLDRLAQQLDTSEVRALRLAAEAAAAITPRLIVAEATAGVRADVIAEDLGHANPSYVYRVLREHRAAE